MFETTGEVVCNGKSCVKGVFVCELIRQYHSVSNATVKRLPIWKNSLCRDCRSARVSPRLTPRLKKRLVSCAQRLPYFCVNLFAGEGY